MKFKWKVEYEIPPLRAIYLAECDAVSEEEVKQIVTKEEPLWRIRKLEIISSEAKDYD
jgi:hypothetical protein